MALQNLHSLLGESSSASMLYSHHKNTEPGGHLVVRDADMIMYDSEHPPPPEGQEPDPAAYMQGMSTIANMNHILVGGALQRGFVVGYALLSLAA